MILFQRKYDRARAFQKEQRKQREGKNAGRDDVEMADLLEKGEAYFAEKKAAKEAEKAAEEA